MSNQTLQSLITLLAAAQTTGGDQSASTPSDIEECPNFVIGEKVLIRTCTYAAIGRVEKFNSTFVWLSEAGWVADTGRYHEALESGKINEYERCPGVRRVAIGAIVDVDEWTHAMPDTQ